MNYDIVVLTEDKYVNQPQLDWYNLQVLLEDELVVDALRQKGLKVGKKSWSDKDFDWSSTRSAIFRTTWDYFDRFDEFSPWLEATAKKTHFINPAEIIRWSMDKRYLLDLQQRGINSVATHILPKGEAVDLEQQLANLGWTQGILKPVISGAARHTYRVNQGDTASVQAKLDALINDEDFMLQPFQHNICEQGELSLMVMGGKVTHAVQKVAKAGDFRVQDDHGGMVYPYTPDAEEIAFAEAAIQACDPQPLYGRVDMIRDNDGNLAIMELELIEPELFFRFHRPAAFALADAISHYLQSL